MKKTVLQNLIPDYRFGKVTDISIEFFEGAQLIVLDVDNTLMAPGTLTSAPDIIAWVAALRQHYRCVIFSNSFSFFKRAQGISQIFQCELFLSRHKKPFRPLFVKMKKKYQVDEAKVVVVGDRLFTDVLFGNTNGARTVLVAPYWSQENIIVKMVRKLENTVLFLAMMLQYKKQSK